MCAPKCACMIHVLMCIMVAALGVTQQVNPNLEKMTSTDCARVVPTLHRARRPSPRARLMGRALSDTKISSSCLRNRRHQNCSLFDRRTTLLVRLVSHPQPQVGATHIVLGSHFVHRRPSLFRLSGDHPSLTSAVFVPLLRSVVSLFTRTLTATSADACLLPGCCGPRTSGAWRFCVRFLEQPRHCACAPKHSRARARARPWHGGLAR